jgi:hypothetical protein
MFIIIGIVYIWLTCAGFTAVIADSRGRDASNWFLLGLAFGVFALVAACAMPVVKQEPESRGTTLGSPESRPWNPRPYTPDWKPNPPTPRQEWEPTPSGWHVKEAPDRLARAMDQLKDLDRLMPDGRLRGHQE